MWVIEQNETWFSRKYGDSFGKITQIIMYSWHSLALAAKWAANDGIWAKITVF